ncbi:hypothetical protein [Neomegalonema sp.]|uniref:hypothetical protein n=1 Tax=Neomegalonema sp. TaxID=2039713 RepID=UPI002612F470|nr:hypothetical protein [Neomegalonema sp.]MDD2867629.1 hypothetical protein [Neomegalonema sp.]
MRILVLGGISLLILSACGREPPAPAPNFASLDRGESLALESGGRGAYGTWHAGPDRGEQATCVEPPAEAGATGWLRFEACMGWFNGLTDRAAYQARLEELGASGE